MGGSGVSQLDVAGIAALGADRVPVQHTLLPPRGRIFGVEIVAVLSYDREDPEDALHGFRRDRHDRVVKKFLAIHELRDIRRLDRGNNLLLGLGPQESLDLMFIPELIIHVATLPTR